MAIRLDTRLKPQVRPERDAYGPRATESGLTGLGKGLVQAGTIIDQADEKAQGLIGLEAYRNYQTAFKDANVKLREVIASGDEEKIEQAKADFETEFSNVDFNNYRPEGVSKRLTRDSVLSNYRSLAKSGYETAVASNEGYESNVNANNIITQRIRNQEETYSALQTQYPEGVPLNESHKKLIGLVSDSGNIQLAYEKYKEQDDVNLAAGRPDQELAKNYLLSQLNEFNRYATLGASQINIPEELQEWKKTISQFYNSIPTFSNYAGGFDKFALDAIDDRVKTVSKNVKESQTYEANKTYNAFGNSYTTVTNSQDFSDFTSNIANAYTNIDNIRFPERLTETEQNEINDIQQIYTLLGTESFQEDIRDYINNPDTKKTIDQLIKFDELNLSQNGQELLNSRFKTILGNFNNALESGDNATAFSIVDPDIKDAVQRDDFATANTLFTERYGVKFTEEGEYISGIKGIPQSLADISIGDYNPNSQESIFLELNNLINKNLNNSANARDAINTRLQYKDVSIADKVIYHAYNLATDNRFNQDQIKTLASHISSFNQIEKDSIDETLINEIINSSDTDVTEFEAAWRTTASGLAEMTGSQYVFNIDFRKTGIGEPYEFQIPETVRLLEGDGAGYSDFLDIVMRGFLYKTIKDSTGEIKDIGQIKREWQEFDKMFKRQTGVSSVLQPDPIGADPGAKNIITLSPKATQELIDSKSKQYTYKGLTNLWKTFGWTNRSIRKAKEDIATNLYAYSALRLFFEQAGDPDAINELAKNQGIDLKLTKKDLVSGKIEPKKMRELIKGIVTNRVAPESKHMFGFSLRPIGPDLRFKAGTEFDPQVKFATSTMQVNGAPVPAVVVLVKKGDVYVPVTGSEIPESKVLQMTGDLIEAENDVRNWEWSWGGKLGQWLDRVRDYNTDNL